MWLVALALAAPLGGGSASDDAPRRPADAIELPGLPLGPSVRVVGGDPVPVGTWDDAVGVVFDASYVGCTGTLIAPDLVITAGHCAGAISHVLVGIKNWAFDNEDYDIIAVTRTRVHPSYDGQRGFDVAVLELAEPSRFPPRVIASDCVLEESLTDGALVTIAGFGNTCTNGGCSTSVLNEVDTLVRDADCSEAVLDGTITGCDPTLRPAGEISAGGRLDVDGDGDLDGPRDSCFGDSGGPLYLRADRGDFLIGVTSRGFRGGDPEFPCRDGGIYARPDAVIDWIEERTGRVLERPQCNEPPAASIDDVKVPSGKSRSAVVVADDPEGTGVTVALASEPTLGTVSIVGDEVTFTAFEGAVGAETVMLTVSDGGSPVWPNSAAQVVTVPWEVEVGGGCGCATGAPHGAVWAGLIGLLALVGRRRV